MRFAKYWKMVGLSALVLAGGCGSVSDAGDTTAAALDISQFAHHRWVLKSINGEPVEGNRLGAYGKGLVPELDFGEAPEVAGFAGCNRYKGQVQLTPDGGFRIQELATTMMLCPDRAMALERRFTDTLGRWSQLNLDQKTLQLSQGEDVWVFELFDWVQ